MAAQMAVLLRPWQCRQGHLQRAQLQEPLHHLQHLRQQQLL
jgi:hypothetical protein